MRNWSTAEKIASGAMAAYVVLFVIIGIAELIKGKWWLTLVFVGVAILQIPNIWRPELLTGINMPFKKYMVHVRENATIKTTNPVVKYVFLLGMTMNIVGLITMAIHTS